jgi:hypothetical protein
MVDSMRHRANPLLHHGELSNTRRYGSTGGAAEGTYLYYPPIRFPNLPSSLWEPPI